MTYPAGITHNRRDAMYPRVIWYIREHGGPLKRIRDEDYAADPESIEEQMHAVFWGLA